MNKKIALTRRSVKKRLGTDASLVIVRRQVCRRPILASQIAVAYAILEQLSSNSK